MKFLEGEVAGAYVVEPEPRADERGSFGRMWCEDELGKHGLVNRIVQVNTGINPRALTLRGMHLQLAPHAEVKVVRCLRGAVYDVAVDLRPESPTYTRWMGVELTGENGRMLYVPEGCAHGYLTLVPDTEVMYFTSCAYAPASARGVRHDDPAFGIRWPHAPALLSAADRNWPAFHKETGLS